MDLQPRSGVGGGWNGLERPVSHCKPRSDVTLSAVVVGGGLGTLHGNVAAAPPQPFTYDLLAQMGAGPGPLVWHAPVGSSGHCQMGLVG